VVRAAAPVHRLHFEVGTNNGVLARQIPTMARADFDDNWGADIRSCHANSPHIMSITETRRAVLGNSRIRIGRFPYGNEHLSVRQWGEGASLTIGSFCSISSAIHVFLGGNHRTDWSTTFPFGHIFEQELGGAGIPGHPATRGDVNIGNDVWIAHGVTIMSGVTVGDGAVLGANSTLVKDVAPYEIVGGNPAMHIKYRFPEEVRNLLLALRWWDLPVQTIRQIAHELLAPPSVERLQSLIARCRDAHVEAGARSPHS
jgi:acetyltransferase-like isoleucine patch superfamily enzyme